MSIVKKLSSVEPEKWCLSNPIFKERCGYASPGAYNLLNLLSPHNNATESVMSKKSLSILRRWFFERVQVRVIPASLVEFSSFWFTRRVSKCVDKGAKGVWMHLLSKTFWQFFLTKDSWGNKTSLKLNKKSFCGLKDG